MRSSAIAWLALLRAFAPTLAFAGANPLPTVADQPKFYFPRVVKRQIFTNTSTITTTATTDTSNLDPVALPTTQTNTNDLESFLNSLINGASITTSVAAAPTGNLTTTATETVVTVTLPPPIPGDAAITLPVPSVPVPSVPVPSVVGSSTLSTPPTTDGTTSTAPFTPGIIPGFTPGVVPAPTTDATATSTNTPILPVDVSLPTVLPTDGVPAQLVAPTGNPLASSNGLPATTVSTTGATGLPVAPADSSQITTPSDDGTLTVPLVPSITPTVQSSLDIPGVLSTMLSSIFPNNPSSTPSTVPLVSDSIVPTTLGLPTTDIPSIGPLITNTGAPTVSNTVLPTVPTASNLQTLPTTGIPTVDTGLPPTNTQLPATNSLGAQPTTDANLTPGITGPATGSETPAATTGTQSTVNTLSPAVITPAPNTPGNETIPTNVSETTPAGTTGESTGDSKSSPAPQTIQPTGTDSATTQWLPPTLVVQTNAPSTLTGAAATQTGIPSGLPKAIAPDGGVPPEPRNTTMIQIGFNYQLPYPFVVANSIAAAQIFSYLPQGISYGLGIPADQVVMRTIEPY